MIARSWLGLVALLAVGGTDTNRPTPDQLLLKDYRPRSIYRIPETRVEKARYPVIDVHSHAYVKTEAQVEAWVRTMDEVGIERTVILSGAVGKRFDDLVTLFARYADRFELWCGVDYSGFDQTGFGPGAVAELRRCVSAGARGVGELSDKGGGLRGNTGGMHLDDPRLDAILEACADLRLPVNIHVGEDRWMYEPMDATNDGLMNGFKWRVRSAPEILSHDAVVTTLERAVARHPRTTFVACHFANCCQDLERLGSLLDRFPNLYADISARYAETAPIPRFVARFYDQYQDRLLYGTDMGTDAEMYRTTFRILESADEHFYPETLRIYHWPLHGFALPDTVLRKVYGDNARHLFRAGPRRDQALDRNTLFDRTNLVAWCIVPFDARKRGPEERAQMLERLGIRRLAYDWRAEHVPTFDAEVAAMIRHQIEITAWWFPTTLDPDAERILEVIQRHRIHPQLWVTGGGEPVSHEAEQEARVMAETARLRPIAEAAARVGCQVALYNHGGWFGDPENQLAVIRRLGLAHVGLVYNFHHGHDHVARFAELFPRMKPHLLAVNLNGMAQQGDRQGKKILHLGEGDQELGMLRIVRDSGWHGPVGILDHREETDSEETLQRNLRGLDSLRQQL